MELDKIKKEIAEMMTVRCHECKYVTTCEYNFLSELCQLQTDKADEIIAKLAPVMEENEKMINTLSARQVEKNSEILKLQNIISSLTNDKRKSNLQIFKLQARIKELEERVERIKKNTKLFLMGRYVVCSGDKYRLNEDDHKRLDEILDGRELKPDEDPLKEGKEKRNGYC